MFNRLEPNAVGDARYTKPKFTSFGDPHLADAFARPLVGTAGPGHYFIVLLVADPVAPLVFWATRLFPCTKTSFPDLSFTPFSSKGSRQTASGHRDRGQSNDRLLQVLNSLLVVLTVIHMAAVACGLYLSPLPDVDNSRES